MIWLSVNTDHLRIYFSCLSGSFSHFVSLCVIPCQCYFSQYDVKPKPSQITGCQAHFIYQLKSSRRDHSLQLQVIRSHSNQFNCERKIDSNFDGIVCVCSGMKSKPCTKYLLFYLYVGANNVCVCVCCLCVSVCVCMCVHTHTHICMLVHLCILQMWKLCVCVCVCVCVYVCVCVSVCMSVCVRL